ncbi:MAG: hypothetical protein QXP27_09860 [Candidatus Methanomethyliaceae archaeon]
MEIGSHKITVSGILLIIAATLLFFGVVFFMASRLSEDKALALYSEYVQQGKRSEAIKVLQNALLSNPDSKSLLSKLGEEHRSMLSDLERLREDRTQADQVESIRRELRKGVDFYSRLISMRPKNFRLYFERADLLAHLENHDLAIRDYTEVIKLLEQEPDSAQKDENLLHAYFSRYSLHREKMDWRGAAADLEKVIDLASKWAPTFECGEDEDGPHCRVLPLVKKWIPQELKTMRQLAALGSDWVYCADLGDSYLFYNRSRITTLPGGRLRVWTRFEPKDDEARQRLAKAFYLPGGSEYSHALSCFELDCENWTYRSLGWYVYDTEGHVLKSYGYPESEPNPVPPESAVEELLDALCKKAERKKYDAVLEMIFR